MKFLDPTLKLRYRQAPLALPGAEFRKLGHELVERIAQLFDELPQRPVTSGESPQAIRQLLGTAPLPEKGAPAGDLLAEATDLLFDHSLLNGHPKFWGYITAAVDPLPEIAALCRQYDLWFHVDGAYGAPAAALPDASPDLVGLREADSIALDPHKWLYSPLEAGCVLVRNPNHLAETFSHHPTYYNFDGIQEDPPINYYAFGMQNSRGFRALKVWLALRQVGRAGYIEMIGDDIALAQALYQTVGDYPELQAMTQNLSITTFRFVPTGLPNDPTLVEPYLNQLNEALLNRLQTSSAAFVSNALVDGKYLLRACIVNFRTTLTDVEALPALVVDLGKMLDEKMRPPALQPEWRYRMSISLFPVHDRPVQPLIDLLRAPSPLATLVRTEQ